MARQHWEYGDTLGADDLEEAFEEIEGEVTKSLKNEGVWSAVTHYDTNDLATEAGLDYRALQPSTNKQPSTNPTYWKVMGGTYLPDGGTTGQALFKASNADGDAEWADVDALAQNQVQSFGFVGVSAILRVGTHTDNFAPGDSTASIKTKLAGIYVDYGALSSDFGISGTNTAPVTPPPTSFTASGSGSHPGNYVQHGTANGVTGYWTGSNSNVIYWDGTHWVSGHLGVGGGADETGGTDITNPTLGWGGTYTFSSIVTPGSSGTFALLITTQGALAGKNLPALESDTASVTLAVPQAGNIAGLPASIDSLQEERQARALKTDKTVSVLAWAYGQSYRLVSGTRDSNGALTSGTIIWPDGATGAFTADTLSTAFPGAVDAYHVTHIQNAVTTTYTQPAVTRDATTGAVTAQPAIIVS